MTLEEGAPMPQLSPSQMLLKSEWGPCLVQSSHVKQCNGNYCKVGTSKIKENVYKVIVGGLECSATLKSSHDWQEVTWKRNKNPIQIQKDQTHNPGARYLLASTDWVQVTQDTPPVRSVHGSRTKSFLQNWFFQQRGCSTYAEPGRL